MAAPAPRMVRAGGADLWVERRGDSPAAVFVHGFGGDLQTWDALWRHLPGDALRYDLRGFGRWRACRSAMATIWPRCSMR